jgi:5-methylcytosine-specific restriction endonuclease McrA
MPTINNKYLNTTKKVTSKLLEPKKEKHPLYASNQWKRYSYMKRSQNPQCERCNKIAHPKDLAVDHKIPLVYGGSFWNHLNHWVLCSSCHNWKTSQERNKQMFESVKDEYGDLIPKI